MKNRPLATIISAMVAFMVTILGLSGPAHADTPDGTIRTVQRDSANKASDFPIVEVGRGVDVARVVQSFRAMYLKATGEELTWRIVQAANPETTIPVCGVPRDGHMYHGRGQTSIWTDCPESQRYVGLIAGPSGRIKIPLTPVETYENTQKRLERTSECFDDATCLKERLASLGGQSSSVAPTPKVASSMTDAEKDQRLAELTAANVALSNENHRVVDAMGALGRRPSFPLSLIFSLFLSIASVIGGYVYAKRRPAVAASTALAMHRERTTSRGIRPRAMLLRAADIVDEEDIPLLKEYTAQQSTLALEPVHAELRRVQKELDAAKSQVVNVKDSTVTINPVFTTEVAMERIRTEANQRSPQERAKFYTDLDRYLGRGPAIIGAPREPSRPALPSQGDRQTIPENAATLQNIATLQQEVETLRGTLGRERAEHVDVIADHADVVRDLKRELNFARDALETRTSELDKANFKVMALTDEAAQAVREKEAAEKGAYDVSSYNLQGTLDTERELATIKNREIPHLQGVDAARRVRIRELEAELNELRASYERDRLELARLNTELDLALHPSLRTPSRLPPIGEVVPAEDVALAPPPAPRSMTPAYGSRPDEMSPGTNGAASVPPPASDPDEEMFDDLLKQVAYAPVKKPVNVTSRRRFLMSNLLNAESVVDQSMVAHLGQDVVEHFAVPRTLLDQLFQLEQFGILPQKLTLPPPNFPPVSVAGA